MNMTRKDFLKTAGACALGAVGTAAGASAPAAGTETGRAKVYFSPVIDSDHLNKLYDLIKDNLSGKIAIKLHTGERHGPNILPREMVKSLQARIPESTIVARLSKRTPSITATATPPRITSRPLKSTAGPSARLTSWTLRER